MAVHGPALGRFDPHEPRAASSGLNGDCVDVHFVCSARTRDPRGLCAVPRAGSQRLKCSDDIVVPEGRFDNDVVTVVRVAAGPKENPVDFAPRRDLSGNKLCEAPIQTRAELVWAGIAAGRMENAYFVEEISLTTVHFGCRRPHTDAQSRLDRRRTPRA